MWTEYLKTNPQIDDIQEKVVDAWKKYAQKLLPAEAIDTYDMSEEVLPFIEKNATLEAKADEKFQMHVTALKLARQAILEKSPSTYFESIKDIYLPVLDKEVHFLYMAILMTSNAKTLLSYQSSSSLRLFGRPITTMTWLVSTSFLQLK